MNSFIYLAPVAGVIALIFAFYKAMTINKSEAGNDRMKEIASAIAEGARAFLFAEYKVLVIFVAVLFVVLGFGISWLTAVCFLVGALFSTLAGYFGMTVATKANVRTANAAKESGMNKALSIAFSGGAVMGLSVVGLGIIGISVIFIILNATGEVTTDAVSILTGFSLGASSIALFARVGGGIYTKAADVGADLVGKVEAGIPEDDPRNPAVIADNVGDNVGDVAGMGADLFESYVGALVSAITLGLVATNIGSASHFMAALFPLVIAGVGIIASVIATFFVRGKDGSDGRVLKSDVTIAKNYLDEKQIRSLERAVTGYFDYIEDLIERENTFTMEEFAASINEFLAFRRYEILPDRGKISRKMANDKAEQEYQIFNRTQVIESDFDREVKKMIQKNDD